MQDQIAQRQDARNHVRRVALRKSGYALGERRGNESVAAVVG